MAARGQLALVFCFVFLLLGIARADISKCSAGCHGISQPTGGYLPGTAYTYTVEGLAKVQLSGTDKQETTVKLAAEAVISGLGNCANLFKITNLQITGPDGTVYNKPLNVLKPVRFTLQDGVLGSEMCVEQDDNQASVNIKRAILSMLQTANKHNTEVDIFGVCPTSFKVRKEGSGVVVTKYRDLNICAHREQGKHDLIHTIYNPSAEIKSANILDSNLRVETYLKDGVVQKVDSIEDYLYVPFSSGSSGAKAQVNTKVVLTDTKHGYNIQANCVVPKSIIFENPHLMNTERSNIDNVLSALRTTIKSLEKNVNSKSATAFIELVRVLRVSNKNDLQNVYSQIKGGSAVKDNKLARKVFLDALFRAGTGDTIEVSADLLQNKEFSPLELRLALISLSAVRHASSGSVKAAIKLLDVANLPNEVYLGVGALGGAYCRDHNCHGATSQDANIAALSNKLASKLGNCKAANKHAETAIIYALKGLRNIHHIEDSIVKKLASCAGDKTVSQRVRVAALETFAADPCIRELKVTALSILKDRQQDSEVRIKAYLALLNCPCANVAGELKTLMEDEPVYQVGSFISSSLRNIRASANPARASAKQYFGGIYPKKNYPLDARKYSHNYELSYEYEMLGVGSVADANVIYSQDSYLPRSANLNLTAEVFGQSLNLIELGYRQGNLDRLIEEYFGPHGVLNTHTPQEIYTGVKKSTLNIFDKIKSRLQESRGKRSVLQQTKVFGNQLKTDVEGYYGNADLDVFVKMFGSEVLFLSLSDEKPTSIESLIDKFFDLIDSGISDAKQFTHEIRNHMILMDSELAFPTALGFALKLNVETAATTRLEFAGNVDVRQILNDPKNSKVDIKFIPSANIEVAGALTIDADVVETGLKVISSLHSSTGTHVIAKLLENGKGFDLQLGLPIEKQELITASHDIVFMTRHKGHEETLKDIKFDTSNRYQFSGCFDQLASAIGLTLCSDISIPWQPVKDVNSKKNVAAIARGPLSGPAKFSVRLDKEDLNGFHITGLYNTKKDSHKTLDITVEAQGTKKSRKISFVADAIDRDDLRSLKLTLNSPAKHLEAEAVLQNSESEKSIMARFLDDKSEYLAKIGMSVSGPVGKRVLKPILLYKVPGGDDKGVKVDGTITRIESGKAVKFSANNLCLLSNGKKMCTEGYWEYESNSGQVDLKFHSDNKKASLTGKYKTQDGSYTGNWDARNTINPSLDFHLDVHSGKKEDLTTFDFVLTHGPADKSKLNKITYSSAYKANEVFDFDKIDVYYKNKFSYPLWEINYETETKVQPKLFKTEFELAYEKSKAEFELAAQQGMKKEDDFYGKLKAKVNNNGLSTELKFDSTGEEKGNFNFKLDLYPGDKHQATGTVNYRLDDDDTNVGLSVKYKSSAKPEEYKFDTGLVKNLKLYHSFLKISIGSADYVDFLAKINKDSAPSGTLKLILKDIIKCDGQFKVNGQDKKGNGVLLIALLKSNKKLKVDTNFLVSKPQYNANIDIYTDFEHDNSKKITIVTNNKCPENAVDSKTTFTFGDQKIDFALKGEFVGDGLFETGKQNFVSSLTHSHGQSVNIKFDRHITFDDNIIGQINYQVVYVPTKNSKPYKFSQQGKIDTKDKFNFENHVTLEKPSGENADVKVFIKKTNKDKRDLYENQLEVHGTLLPNPVSFYGSFDVDDDETSDVGDAKYRIKSSYGSKASVDLSGKLNYDIQDNSDTLLKNEIDATITLPLEKAHTIKLTYVDEFFEPKDESYIKGRTGLVAQINSDVYKYDISGLVGKDQGNAKLFVHVPHYNKFLLESNYKRDREEGKPTKYNNAVNVEYGENQKFTYTVKGESVPKENGHFIVNIGLPSNIKQCKNIKYDVKYKGTAEARLVETVLDIDGKKYTVNYNYDFKNPKAPLIDLKGTGPEVKPYRFYLKGDALEINTLKGDLILENIGTINLNLHLDGTVNSADDFKIKVDIDSAKLHCNKVQFETYSEGGKKVFFSAKEDNKNILSGSTTYDARHEGDKFMMEGSGSLKLRDQQKSTSFKFIKDRISEEHEKGIEVFFNLAIGEKSTVIEYKNTNLAYKFSSAYCEEKKQCAHIDINNKFDNIVPRHLQHNLQVTVDLKKLGFIPEFGLQTSTKWVQPKLPEHTFDVHINLDKSKYHTQVYAKPVKGNYVTALTMTLPHRVVSLESSTTYVDVETKQSAFPFQHEINLYMNKNANPQSKTTFKVNADVQRVPGKQINAVGDITFTSPQLGKNLQVSGKSHYDDASHALSGELVLDIFKKKTQKIVMTTKINPVINDQIIKLDSEVRIEGKDLGFDAQLAGKLLLSQDELKINDKAVLTLDKQKKESTFVVDFNKDSQRINFRVPSSEIVNYESSVKSVKGGLELGGSLCLFQEKPVLFKAEAHSHPYYSFKVSTGHSDSGSVVLSGLVEPLKRSEIRAEIIQGKEQKSLAHVGFKMENKALKSDSGLNEANIKQFAISTNEKLKALLTHIEQVNKKIQEEGTKDVQKIVHIVQGAAPDIPAVSNYFKEEIKKIGTELENDKNLQVYLKSLNDVIKATLKVINEFMEKATGVIQETVKIATETCNNVVTLFNERLLPELSKFYVTITTAVSDIFKNIFNIALHFVTMATDFLEKHAAELKPLFESFNSIFNDISQILAKRIEEVTKILSSFCDTIKGQLSNMPILQDIQAKLKEFEIPEKITEIIKGFVETINPLLPTDELKKFVDQLSTYVQKKVNNENCNDLEELKLILKSYISAMDSLAVYFKNQFGEQDLTLDSLPTSNFFKPGKAPKPGIPSLSPLNYLGKEKIPSLEDLILAYRPKSLNPLELVPPFRLRGIIAGGQHIFTFDGRHLTFPGTCKYVVSQDAVDGNFSIVLTLEKGIAKSINVIDKSGADVEVNIKNQLAYNGSPYGFPLIKSGILAFKDVDSFTIKTQYGARVRCSLSLDMCYFEVSGFYIGKLRGLLGDGNNEPYDDFRLPNGKITTSESEFGNSYALTSGCPKVQTVDHSHHHGHAQGHDAPGVCNSIFSKETPEFALCYYAVNPDNYKQACQHATQGLSGDKAKKEACLIASAYALACNSVALPTALPDTCAQCEVNGEVYKDDEEFEVKTPQKQADIILAVETTKANEKTYRDLVVPVMSQIIDELKKSKVDDVKVYLVGVTPNLPYPIYYDINNNKLQGAKIDFKYEQRSKAWESPITTENEKVDKILNSLAVLLQNAEIELGLNSIHWTYARLGRLQLRPKAVKSIIMVHSEPCAEAIFPIIFGSALSEVLMTGQGIVGHLITPVKELELGHKPGTQVVGFNEDHVFLLNDKKRGLSNSNLRSSLSFQDDDVCMGHALETYGNVYTTENFAKCNAGQKKTYINMIAQTIVDSLTQVTLSSECKCETDLFTLKNKVTCSVDDRTDKRKPSSKK